MSTLDLSNISQFNDSPLDDEHYLAEAKEAGFETIDEYIEFLNKEFQDNE